jgi:hypothetical protein
MASQWRELTAEQRRLAADAIQLYDHFLEFAKETREIAGGMFWKTVKGRDYLVRSLDREGHIRSLGPRSPQTEVLFREFTARKKALRARSASVRSELQRRQNSASPPRSIEYQGFQWISPESSTAPVCSEPI